MPRVSTVARSLRAVRWIMTRDGGIMITYKSEGRT